VLKKMMMAACVTILAAGLAGCSSDDGDPVILTTGQLNYTWTLTDSGGAAIDCPTGGIVSASFLATRASDNMGFDDIYNCADFQGESAPMGFAESFTVSPCALDANDACLSAPGVTFQADTGEPCDFITEDGSCIVNAPLVVFAINI
jgi:hypothetical protein